MNQIQRRGGELGEKMERNVISCNLKEQTHIEIWNYRENQSSQNGTLLRIICV